MQIVVLLGFMATLAAGEMFVSARPDVWLAVEAAGYVLGAGAMARLAAASVLRAIRRHGELRRRDLFVQSAMSVMVQAWLVGGSAGLMLAGYSTWALQTLRLDRIPLAREAGLLTPFVAALLAVWIGQYRLHVTMRRRLSLHTASCEPPAATWTLGKYLEYNIRHNLLLMAVPLGIISLGTDMIAMYLLPPKAWPYAEAIVALESFAWAAAVLLVVPALIVRIWRTEAMPAGDLKFQLDELCRHLRLRCRAVLLWRTGGVIANAGVMGLIASLRYVLLSDLLVERMNPLQVQAVLGHEAGHAREHHLPYFLLLVAGSLMLGGGLVDLLDFAGEYGSLTAAMVLLAAWCLCFGRLSRLFERQCDVIGAWAVSHGPLGRCDGMDEGYVSPEGAAVMASALEQIAVLNGIPRSQRNWRHGSIERRVEHLMWLGTHEGTRRRIDRKVRNAKRVLWLVFTAGILLQAALI